MSSENSLLPLWIYDCWEIKTGDLQSLCFCVRRPVFDHVGHPNCNRFILKFCCVRHSFTGKRPLYREFNFCQLADFARTKSPLTSQGSLPHKVLFRSTRLFIINKWVVAQFRPSLQFSPASPKFGLNL